MCRSASDLRRLQPEHDEGSGAQRHHVLPSVRLQPRRQGVRRLRRRAPDQGTVRKSEKIAAPRDGFGHEKEDSAEAGPSEVSGLRMPSQCRAQPHNSVGRGASHRRATGPTTRSSIPRGSERLEPRHKRYPWASDGTSSLRRASTL
jgi:hypothetical protein